MNKQDYRRMYEMLDSLKRKGVSNDDGLALRRISMTLHRWGELECGWDNGGSTSFCLEREEGTDKPFIVAYPAMGKGWRHATPDREKGALKRLAAIMARYPELAAYHQTDPRGAALYVVERASIPAGSELDNCYNIGTAVY